MQSNCIKNLLNLKGVIVKKIENLENFVKVYVELPVVENTCPCCNSKTKNIHDYRIQPILDLPIQFKSTKLIYRKRRYVCKHCGKRFAEDNEIVHKFSRKTNRLVEYVVNELGNLISCKDISKKTNISANFISKMLPYLAVTTSTLPRVLCIDEFKGNANGIKYQVALINGETHEVVDILECRYKHALCQYFKRFPKEQLDNVKYVVTDLWEPYIDISFTYFRKAKVIADRFHFVRYVMNAVNDIRIKVQKELPKEEKRFFKNSRKLLLSRKTKLKTEEQLDKLSYILINFSEDLRIAYREKEKLLDIIHSKDTSEFKIQKFSAWVTRNLESPIPQIQECAKTFQHWYQQIKNSFEVPYSNGPTEGFNNKIKTLKRVSFGIKKFENLKARILLLNR